MNRAPHVLGYFYDRLDREPSPRQKADRLRRVVQRLNLSRFVRLLRSEPWDAVVNTHFLPAELIASLRREGSLRVAQFTVTTDFAIHRLWVQQPCDHYYTATEEGGRYLAHWGVPQSDITASGIPIHPDFGERKDLAECRRELGLREGRPVVLHLSGGFGVGPVAELHRRILEVRVPLEIVVVTGRNQALRGELESLPVPDLHRVKVLGYTERMDRWMAVADLVVSKPGGLTTSELLSQGAAMAIVNPIPGQEDRNADYLLENGAAVKINHPATLSYKLNELLGDRRRLNRLKRNARRLGRPRAAGRVARDVLARVAGP